VDGVAVGGRDLERTRAYAREHAIERAYGSYGDLLADPDVDAVYISLPNTMHVDWTLRALRAGKHVLCEKPFSRSAVETEAAFDLAEANGLLLMEAFMYRHHPQTRLLTRLVREGAIGEVRLLRAVFAFNAVRIFGGTSNIRLEPQLDGGALMDVGAYCVSAVRIVAGEPTRVFASQRVGPSGVDVATIGTLEFGDGVLAGFECAFDVESRTEFEVLGSEGRIWVRHPWRIENPGVDLLTPAGAERIDCEDADPYLLQLDDFSAAIAERGQPLLGREDALAQARALEGLWHSARTGAPVELV